MVDVQPDPGALEGAPHGRREADRFVYLNRVWDVSSKTGRQKRFNGSIHLAGEEIHPPFAIDDRVTPPE